LVIETDFVSRQHRLICIFALIKRNSFLSFNLWKTSKKNRVRTAILLFNTKNYLICSLVFPNLRSLLW
jgi:hypothetical protein